MDRDEIIRLLKYEIQLEKGCLDATEYVYRNTWNIFTKIYYKIVSKTYIHSYVTLCNILDKIEERSH